MTAFETATVAAAWVGAVSGVSALLLALRAVRRTRVPPKRPHVEARLVQATHTRSGPTTVVSAILDLQNTGDDIARVHVVEAELDAMVSGAAGLRKQKRSVRTSLPLRLPPGARERAEVQFTFLHALVPDGDVPVLVRVVHEKGTTETAGATRKQ